LEILGGDLIGRVSYRFNLTELGRKRASEAMKMCAYVGPAPVPLEYYVEQVYRQAVTNIDINPEMLKAALGHLVISDELFNAVGGLHLSMRDLRYNPEANFYQAPLHVKANGGIFLIDDFGRQLCSPKELLNRWIVPLENRIDYLSLSSGQQFQVPFEQLTMFSTNLDPRDLVDDAFLRRMRHKVEIMAPPRKIYEKIFGNYARKLGMNPCPEAVDYLFEKYYSRGRTTRASDARDLL